MKIQRLIAASLLLLAMMSLSSVALAQQCPYVKGCTNQPNVLGDKTAQNPATDSSSSSTNSSTLPFTGADVVLILLVGFAAIGTGTVLVRRFRVREEI